SRREAVGLELVEELAGQSLVVLVETPNSDAGDTEDTGVRPCGLAEELGEVAGGERRTRAEPDERLGSVGTRFGAWSSPRDDLRRAPLRCPARHARSRSGSRMPPRRRPVKPKSHPASATVPRRRDRRLPRPAGTRRFAAKSCTTARTADAEPLPSRPGLRPREPADGLDRAATARQAEDVRTIRAASARPVRRAGPGAFLAAFLAALVGGAGPVQAGNLRVQVECGNPPETVATEHRVVVEGLEVGETIFENGLAIPSTGRLA